MAVRVARLTATRDEDDRTQEALDFIEEVAEVCRRRGFAIAHEDMNRPAQVYRFRDREALEPNLAWLLDAAEVRWLDEDIVGPAPAGGGET